MEAQEDFTQSVSDLSNVVANFSQYTDLSRMDQIVAEVGALRGCQRGRCTSACIWARTCFGTSQIVAEASMLCIHATEREGCE